MNWQITKSQDTGRRQTNQQQQKPKKKHDTKN